MSPFRKRVLMIALAGAVLAVAGCGTRRDVPDDKVLAKINNYDLTVADFKYEGGLTLANKYFSDDPEKAKEDMLDELITKKVLMQEAQREGLDKEKAFMLEIEKYWEQALVKFLMKDKAAELRQAISVDDAEMAIEYKKMKRKINANIVVLKDEQEAGRLSGAGADFDAVKEEISASGGVLSDQTDWWVSGDLPDQLEDALFGLKEGTPVCVTRSGQNWVVMRYIGEEERPLPAYSSAAQGVKEFLVRKKLGAKMDEWIKELKDKAVIKVDKRALRSIDIEGLKQK